MDCTPKPTYQTGSVLFNEQKNHWTLLNTAIHRLPTVAVIFIITHLWWWYHHNRANSFCYLAVMRSLTEARAQVISLALIEKIDCFKSFLIPVIPYFDQNIINLQNRPPVGFRIAYLFRWYLGANQSYIMICRQKIYSCAVAPRRLLKTDIIYWVNIFIIAYLFRPLVKSENRSWVFQNFFFWVKKNQPRRPWGELCNDAIPWSLTCGENLEVFGSRGIHCISLPLVLKAL